MGQAQRTYIQVGGPLPRSKVIELCAAISREMFEYDVHCPLCRTETRKNAYADTEESLLELRQPKGYLEFTTEPNYGELQEFEVTLMSIGLTWKKWVECPNNGESDARVEWWSPAYDSPLVMRASDEYRWERVITEKTLGSLRRILADANPGGFSSAQEVIKEAIAAIDAFCPPLPETPELEVTDA